MAYHDSHTTRADLVADLWLAAGRQAIAQPTIEEWLRYLAQGLKQTGKLPDDAERHRRELSLLLNLGVALPARAGHHVDRVTAAYKGALALAGEVGSE